MNGWERNAGDRLREILVFGHVRTISDNTPISMIKVSVYCPDLTLIGRAYTDDEGYHSVDRTSRPPSSDISKIAHRNETGGTT
jgi:hypothetical protein